VKPLDQCRLYTFVDTAYLGQRDPRTVAQALCDGGSDLIQIRAKQGTSDEIERLADLILPITRQAKVRLVINDHPQIAESVGAPFCHLGQEDFFDAGYTNTSAVLPNNPAMKWGLSSHAPEQAERAIRAGADYIAIGPVFATPTKPGRPPVTVDYVRWASQHVPIPWFAIGGITLENLDTILDAGARRICVVSAILNQPDIAAACRAFADRL